MSTENDNLNIEINPELNSDEIDNISEQIESNSINDEIASLTETLQRVQAEYLNYRKRVERDKEQSTVHAFTYILLEFLPVLDDLERAAAHQELVGGFKAVSDRINNIVENLGLTKFSDINVIFDPEIHEALAYEPSNDSLPQTIIKVLQPGYKYKNKVIRPARVVVSQPQNQK
jgi:molecular chaperone GrpE